jgi:hypothetical protein
MRIRAAGYAKRARKLADELDALASGRPVEENDAALEKPPAT